MRPRTDIGRLPALVLLLAAGAARAGELRLELAPAELPLCADETALLRVQSAAEPLLAASAGRLSPPRPDGPGRWVATYRPPEECHPQLAVVSAAAGGQWAWAVARLSGRGDALVNTAPGAVISVRIGDRGFGPATADARGRALVPVEVPPGVRAVRHGKRAIPLDLPPMQRVHVAVDRLALPADRGGAVAVRAFAVQDDGAPADAVALRLSASQGRLGAPRVIEPGAVEALWELEPGRAGVAAVGATLPGHRGGEARAEVERPAGVAARAALVALPAALAAGEAAPLQVRARLEDALGNPAAGPAHLAASFGEVLRFGEVGPGEWAGEVRVPPELGDRRSLELAVDAGAATARTAVRLRPGEPAQIWLAVEEPALLADGRGEAQLRLRAADRYGNLVDEPPGLSSDLGRLGAPAPDGSGGWLVRYRAPRLEQATWDGLSARLGGARASDRIRLLARSRTLTLSAKGGMALRPGGSSPAASLELCLWPEALRGRGGLGVEVGWWAFARTDTVHIGGQPLILRGRADMATLLLTALGRTRLGEHGSAWVGAGGGAVLVAARVAQGALAGATETGVAPELHALAGAGWRLGPGAPFLEVRAGWQGAATSALRGSLLTWTLSLGYRLEMR